MKIFGAAILGFCTQEMEKGSGGDGFKLKRNLVHNLIGVLGVIMLNIKAVPRDVLLFHICMLTTYYPGEWL